MIRQQYFADVKIFRRTAECDIVPVGDMRIYLDSMHQTAILDPQTHDSRYPMLPGVIGYNVEIRGVIVKDGK